MQRIRAFVRFAIESRRKAMSIDCDVVYATSTPLTIAIPGVGAAKSQRVPMVFEVRDLWPKVPIAMGAIKSRPLIYLAKRLERYAYDNAAHIVALSPDMKVGICQTGYPSSQVTVVPNASNHQSFNVSEASGRHFREQYEWLGDRPLVVYTGTFGRVNGVEYLVRLAAKAQSIAPDVRFALMGDGCELESTRKLAQELGVLNKNVHILPPIAKYEMPQVLSAADIATSVVINKPELWANSANKAFEAFAASRPLAINHEGWLADTIRNNDCGLVLPPTDLDSAARSLVDAIRNESWQKKSRASARQLALREFDQDILVTRIENVLDSVTNNVTLPQQVAA